MGQSPHRRPLAQHPPPEPAPEPAQNHAHLRPARRFSASPSARQASSPTSPPLPIRMLSRSPSRPHSPPPPTARPPSPTDPQSARHYLASLTLLGVAHRKRPRHIPLDHHSRRLFLSQTQM